MIGIFGPQSDAGITIQPQPSAFGLSGRHLHAFVSRGRADYFFVTAPLENGLDGQGATNFFKGSFFALELVRAACLAVSTLP